MTDWSRWGSCTQCGAKVGDACYLLLAAGPESIPSRYADSPHPCRPELGVPKAPKRATRARGATRNPTARRSASRTDAQAAAWLAVAARQEERS